MRPVSELILKVRSRCNLACDYCYVYELRDTTWKHQPVSMDMGMVRLISSRISEYHPPILRVLFHGGEPLLAGADFLAEAAGIFRSALPDTRLSFGIQTNGTLLNRDNLTTLGKAGISVGLSTDGTREIHDQHRKFPSGKPSWDLVNETAMLLGREFRDIYGGLLMVADLDADPVPTYEALNASRPPSVDFQIPLSTWDYPPLYQGEGRYGRWLAEVFDHWSNQPAEVSPRVRLFHIIIARLLGRDRRAGFIGPPPRSISVVIQPDGKIQLLDAAYTVADGAADTGMNISSHSFEEIARYPGFSPPLPCQECQECQVFSICGGGYWPTRHGRDRGFGNPSVHCQDYLYLINHIRDAVSLASGQAVNS